MYDAVLVVSFGGPEGPDEVMPFLENVTRGRPVPRDRLIEVAAQYAAFNGVSPINGLNRELVGALREELRRRGPDVPVYWGNRNWRPFLADTLRQMTADGIRRAAAFVTSAYGSYSSCQQYLEDIARAREEAGPGAPQVDKLRLFYNHPGFIEPQADLLRDALAAVPDRSYRVLFTAHSLPESMARASPYQAQIAEAVRLVVERAGGAPDHEIVYQSRSGAPAQPWLGPDIDQRLLELAAEGAAGVIVVPIGFVADHMEVVHDLDLRARAVAEKAGLALVRVPTAGSDPRFVSMIRDLVVEREEAGPGQPDACPADCCLPPADRPG